ncbi:hypothetical protein GGTG_05922 [Gaeumannomyces tritici R3-111a-1]|uniref:Uncharacterized protein n=1 Tax=Gaeumannomyces tritici (strain R3-111a-1) TaxID=644352 RepID=J3NXB5_GAET3|nr:hypothetical protein GGTG_05922 [Gaeumannomyces tritici R3-111a-1]EJT75997.1 hypothetical protein GGTG_05922 [Gaeumannomyces tritici R3-111a-1]
MERAGTVSFGWMLNDDKVRDGRYGPSSWPSTMPQESYLRQNASTSIRPRWPRRSPIWTKPPDAATRNGSSTPCHTLVTSIGATTPKCSPASPTAARSQISSSRYKGQCPWTWRATSYAPSPKASTGSAPPEAFRPRSSAAGRRYDRPDVTACPALLALPELVIGGTDGLRKANGWLLGVIAAQVPSGRPGIVANYASATSVGAEISRQSQITTALELLVLNREVALPKCLRTRQRSTSCASALPSAVTSGRDYPSFVTMLFFATDSNGEKLS